MQSDFFNGLKSDYSVIIKLKKITRSNIKLIQKHIVQNLAFLIAL